MGKFKTRRERDVKRARRLLLDVCEENDIDTATVVGRSRRACHVDRRIFVARALAEHGIPRAVIGEVMGGRDYSTVLHYLRSDEERAERNEKLRYQAHENRT